MKTAMQELYEDLEKFKEITSTISITDVQRMIGHYALEKEKQQIIEAHNKGQQYYNPGYNPDVSEQYYKETFS